MLLRPRAPRTSRPRRALTLVVIAGLAGGTAVLGAAPAAAVPGTPTITSPPSGSELLDGAVTVSGTAVTGVDQIVQVRVEDADGVGVDDCVTPVAEGDTDFSCSVGPLPDGDYTVFAVSAEDGPLEPEESPPSPDVAVTVDSTLQAEITNGDLGMEWETFQPLMEGTGPALGTVEVEAEVYTYITEFAYTVVYCTADVDATGAWSCSGDPLPGSYTYFTAYGIDSLGVAEAPKDSQVDGTILGSPPEVELELVPAGIDATVTGIDGTYSIVEFYSVVDGVEGYEYGEPDVICPEGAGDPAQPAPTGAIQPTATTEQCSFRDLEPGIWNVYAGQAVEDGPPAYRDDYVLIPEAPAITTIETTTGEAVFEGTGGVEGDRIAVSTTEGTPVCETTVSGALTWTCSADRPSGAEEYWALAQSSGFEATPPDDFGPSESFDGFSAYSAVRSATVPAPPPPPPPPPAPPAAPAPPPPPFVESAPIEPLEWTLLGAPEGPIQPGDRFELSGTGLPDGAQVSAELRSTPRALGTTTVQDSAFVLPVTVPLDMEPGDHTLVVSVVPQEGTAAPVAQPVVVVVPNPSEGDGAGEEPTDVEEEPSSGASSGGASGSTVRDDPAAPSALTDAIPTIAEIFRAPIVTVLAGGVALAILLLVAFPTELLNSTLSSNTRRFGRGFARFENGVDRVTDWFAQVTRTRAVAAAVLILLTSVIFGFVDPEFGLDPVSVRLTIALALGLFLVTYASSWISSVIIWRRWRIEASIGLQPAALVFAVLGVIVARLLDFSPGFLVGLVIGLELVSRVGAPHRVRAVLTQLGVMVGIAVLAWLGYSVLTEFAPGELDYGTALALDTLVAATAEGLTAAMVAILPLGFLEGREIFVRSKRLWAFAFLVIGTLFSLLVLPTAAEGDDVGDLGVWMLVLIAFAVVTLALWAVLHVTDPDRHDRDEEELETESVSH